MSKPSLSTPAQTFVRNLRHLKSAFRLSSKQIAERSGVSVRMVDYILAGQRQPTVDVAEQIGRVFGLTGWAMIHPNLTAELARRGKLGQLIADYASADEEGKDLIERLAAREASGS